MAEVFLLKSVVEKRITFSEKYVPLQVHPESDDEINNYRATKSEERQVNEIEANFRSCYVKFFCQVGAYAKGAEFNVVSKPFHKCGVSHNKVSKF
jgi:hypothetical protein